ncbi:MAG: PHP domain-containing protein [Candidatus Sumerlaeia bacterium]
MTAAENFRVALVLRDAIFASENWADVEGELRRRDCSIEAVRQALKPRIGFDPHNHTIHSDGALSYRQLLWWCKAVGLPAIGVTDHDNIHPSIGDAIEEANELGLRLAPGLEMTLNRLGGDKWKGLEINLHFFPGEAFARFIRSDAGAEFCERFRAARENKSKQGWASRELVNEKMMKPWGLRPIEEDELWLHSGKTDPVCSSTLTIIILDRFFEEDRMDLFEKMPNTREIYTHMQKNDMVPAVGSSEQTLDDVIAIREELRRQGIRSTATLNHPEEWLSKCGLRLEDGTPDIPAIRRLVALLLLHDPVRCPFHFLELYSGRSSNETRRLFRELADAFEALRESAFPQLAPLHPIAATDSHRITGLLDDQHRIRMWVPGEDFLFGMGLIDEAHPDGNLYVPENYPDADSILRRMEAMAC